MLKLIFCVASLALLATPATADPDKNESGKRYEEQRDRDGSLSRFYENDRPRSDASGDYRRNDRYGDRRVSRAIPAGQLPPPGSCRVWLYDKPAGHQSPPTNCRLARDQAARSGGPTSDRRYR